MKSRILERGYPYVFGVLAFLAAYKLDAHSDSGRFDSMLTSAISVTAILLGFLGTAKAMLLSFKSAKFNWMRSNRVVWGILLGYLRVALLTNFWVCLASLLILGLSTKQIPVWATPYVVPVWMGVFTISVTSFYRVVSVFFAILKTE